MGWNTSRNWKTDARSLKGDRAHRGHSFEKKGVVHVVSVSPGTVDGEAVAEIALTVAGVQVSKWHRVVIESGPALLEPGLVCAGIAITASDEVTVRVENQTLDPIEGSAHDWAIVHFARRAT